MGKVGDSETTSEAQRLNQEEEEKLMQLVQLNLRISTVKSSKEGGEGGNSEGRDESHPNQVTKIQISNNSIA